MRQHRREVFPQEPIWTARRVLRATASSDRRFAPKPLVDSSATPVHGVEQQLAFREMATDGIDLFVKRSGQLINVEVPLLRRCQAEALPTSGGVIFRASTS